MVAGMVALNYQKKAQFINSEENEDEEINQGNIGLSVNRDDFQEGARWGYEIGSAGGKLPEMMSDEEDTDEKDDDREPERE